MNLPALADIASFSRDLVLEASELLLEMQSRGVEIAATKSSDVDIVTEADRACETLIRRRIHEFRPQDGFVGEEGAFSESASGLHWVVDPIDGTVNYLYGVPHWAVSIALVQGNPLAKPWSARTLVGTVVNPAQGNLYQASLGQGAMVNMQPIHIGHQTELSQSLLAAGFSYSPETRNREAQCLLELLPAVRDLRSFGSPVLNMCALASGQVDIYFETETYPWDFAASSLIAREAGARVGGLRGNAEGYSMVLGTNDALFDLVREYLERHF